MQIMLETAQTMKLLDTLTSRYVCQIPSLEQIDIRWEYEINNYNNPGNWNILKEVLWEEPYSLLHIQFILEQRCLKLSKRLKIQAK